MSNRLWGRLGDMFVSLLLNREKEKREIQRAQGRKDTQHMKLGDEELWGGRVKERGPRREGGVM